MARGDVKEFAKKRKKKPGRASPLFTQVGEKKKTKKGKVKTAPGNLRNGGLLLILNSLKENDRLSKERNSPEVQTYTLGS